MKCTAMEMSTAMMRNVTATMCTAVELFSALEMCTAMEICTSMEMCTWSASAILSLIFQLCLYVANAYLAGHFIPILVSKLLY